MGGKGGTRSFSAPGVRGLRRGPDGARQNRPITGGRLRPAEPRHTHWGIQQTLHGFSSLYNMWPQGASPQPQWPGPRTDRGSHLRSVLRLRSRGHRDLDGAAEHDSGSRCPRCSIELVRRSSSRIPSSGTLRLAHRRCTAVAGEGDFFRSNRPGPPPHQCRFSTGRRTGSQTVPFRPPGASLR